MKKIYTYVSLIILTTFVASPVFAQYGPILSNYPGQYDPVITNPGATGATGTVQTIQSDFGWYTQPSTTYTPYYGPINDGSYAPTIMNPGNSYNNTGGTVGTSSTGWNGWYTPTTSSTTTGGTTTTGSSTTGTGGTTTGTTTSGGSGTTGAPSGLASVSSLGSSFINSQIATVSGAWSNNGGVVGTWFEYGTSQGALSQRSVGFQQNTLSGSWSEQLSGLNPNTTYYYRAVTENTYGRNYGAIRSFRTRSLSGSTTGTGSSTGGISGGTTTGTTGTTTGTGGTTTGSTVVSTGAIKISNRYTNICPSDEIDYAITYKNTTGRKLNDVTIKVYLPTSIEYRSSTTGTYRAKENAVTVLVGSLNPNESGIVYVTGEATSDSYGSNRLDARAEIIYDSTNGAELKEQAVVTNTSEDCKDSSLGAAAIFGGGFLPTTFLGWLFLILFILFIVWLSRKFMYKPAHHGGDHGHGGH